jgi:hypothetical protein
MLYKEVKAFFHKPVYLQEVSRNQYGNSIFDIELRSSILLDGWLFGIIVITLLKIELPATSTSSDTLEYIISLLLLLVLFHREYVVKEPLEDDGIAVNRDIDFILV